MTSKPPTTKKEKRKNYKGRHDEWVLKTGYVVIGSPSLPQTTGFFLRGDELKKVVAQLRRGEDLRIVHGEWVDEKGAEWSYNEFVAVDTHHIYTEELSN